MPTPQNIDDTAVTDPIITLQTINHQDWQQAKDPARPEDSIPGMWGIPANQPDKLYHILEAVDLKGTFLHTACGQTMLGDNRPHNLIKNPPIDTQCLRCRIASMNSEYRRIRDGE
ncbi:hypothetical protein [Bifidobacterium callitrichidarum]|uniref:Uncharacterized protein n=1 Tax=Bifidobacterium callitrichidarum TaxID=2052941 RepID=A0A2U2N917_9BIFI|nr:hypothetical protein [Bifidobacterium callitrichidarum]PWG65656.1 hypothetical protein DF196_06910 [Bifidobacterium callitrichidarum]